MNLHVGEVIRLRSFRDNPNPRMQDERSGIILHQISFQAPKGEVFLALLLGFEKTDGSDALPLAELLKRVGLRPVDE